MNKQINLVNNLENEVLILIVRSLGATIFDMNTFLGLQLKTGLAKSELKLALLGLCKNSKIISMRRIAGERVYCVPFDGYFEHMIEYAKGKLHSLTLLDDAEEDGESTGQDLVMDMIVMLGWIGKEQPKLNKKGQLDKKQVEVLLQQIRLAPERLTELVGHHTTKLSFPLPIAILIDLGLRCGMISIVDGQFRLIHNRIAEWLEHTPAEIKLRLYHLWFQVHYPELEAIRLLLVCLPLLPTDQWVSIDDLSSWIMDELLGGQTTAELNQQQFIIYLHALEELGWIEQGQAVNGKQAVRSKLGLDKAILNNQQELWYVQPDFEIIVPLGVSYIDHYKINTYARLMSRNRIYTYRITKDSIFEAFQQGWTSEHVLKHLESLARHGIPRSIEISIVDWSKQYRGVQLEAVTILRCETQAIADELMAIPEISRILNKQNRLQAEVFLIPESDVDFIKGRMNAFGYQTDKKHMVNQPNPSDAEAREINFGIFHSPIRYDMYTQDKELPGIESLYSGFDDVPSGWLNTYHTYHMSTRIQLLHQAIDWQCYVQVAHEGVDIILAPITLNLEDSTPHIEGYYQDKKLVIAIANLEAMQLILPGIHDVTKYMSTTD